MRDYLTVCDECEKVRSSKQMIGKLCYGCAGKTVASDKIIDAPQENLAKFMIN